MFILLCHQERISLPRSIPKVEAIIKDAENRTSKITNSVIETTQVPKLVLVSMIIKKMQL